MALPDVPALRPPKSEPGEPPQTQALADSDPNKALDPTLPSLDRLKRYFNEYRDLTSEARTESLIDIDYYDSKQWTGEEKAALAKRKQPPSVDNRIKIAINGIIGVVARGKSDPRAWPRTPQDEGAADVATDVLRYAADINRWQRTKLECFRDMLVPGTMAVIVGADPDLNPTITQIRWEEFFADPRSRREDFKDARYLGIAKWMYADDVAAIYPDQRAEIESAVDNAIGGGMTPDASFQDRPEWAISGWVDRKQRRILIVEMFYRDGGAWLRCVFHGSGILECGESPYLDHKGRPHCPIEAQSAYVTRENHRYGLVRDMRDLQDGINKRKSKLLHLVSVSQIEVADPSAINIDPDEARAEAARPDGVIPLGWRRVPTADMAEGQGKLLQFDMAAMERHAPNPAMLGRDANDSSGRALLARQQAGLVELALVYSGADDWELRVYRQVWARVKQYWADPQYIRVTDDEGAPKFVYVNEPVMGRPIPTIDPTAPGGVALKAPVLGYRNRIGEMDVDIEVDTQQDVGTLAQEQFSDLMQMLSANPAWAQTVPLEVMIKLSSIPHKQSLLDQIKQAREEAQAAQAPQAQMQAALAASQIEERKARANQLNAAAGAQGAKAVRDLHSAHAALAAPLVDSFHQGVADETQSQAPPPGAQQPLQPGVPGVNPAS